MLRAPLLLALAPASAACDGNGSGAHAACCRPGRWRGQWWVCRRVVTRS